MDKIRDRFLWFLAQDLMDLNIVPFGKLVIEIIVEELEGVILTNIYVQASGFSSQDRVLDGSHRNNHRLGYDQVQTLYLAQSSFFTFFRAFEEISKDITKINLYDIKDYHTSEIGDFFRLRIGKYRAIFKIDKNIIIILVLDIGS